MNGLRHLQSPRQPHVQKHPNQQQVNPFGGSAQRFNGQQPQMDMQPNNPNMQPQMDMQPYNGLPPMAQPMVQMQNPDFSNGQGMGQPQMAPPSLPMQASPFQGNDVIGAFGNAPAAQDPTQPDLSSTLNQDPTSQMGIDPTGMQSQVMQQPTDLRTQYLAQLMNDFKNKHQQSPIPNQGIEQNKDLLQSDPNSNMMKARFQQPNMFKRFGNVNGRMLDMQGANPNQQNQIQNLPFNPMQQPAISNLPYNGQMQSQPSPLGMAPNGNAGMGGGMNHPNMGMGGGMGGGMNFQNPAMMNMIGGSGGMFGGQMPQPQAQVQPQAQPQAATGNPQDQYSAMQQKYQAMLQQLGQLKQMQQGRMM